MRKKIIVLFIALMFANVSFAQGQYASMIAKIENSLFGVEYSSQPDAARIERIEKSVYGTTSSGPIQARVDKLKDDLAADLIGKEIKPKEDTFMEDDTLAYQEDIPKADKSVNYPVVDQLEQMVFKREYKAQDISSRLSNLEKKTFSQTYNDDLNTRVERLKTAIVPQRTMDDTLADAARADDFYSENFPSQEHYYQSQPSFPRRRRSVLDDYDSGRDVTVSLAALEKSVLKKNYPNDDAESRIGRLENKLFSTKFTEDDPQTRLDRVSSAYRAQKTSSRYDTNKFSQHITTAVQIGTMILMVLACVL